MINETNELNGLNQLNENNGRDQAQNKKSKWKFIIGGLFIVIAIAIGLYIGYQKLNSNPTVIYKNAINGIYGALNNSIEEAKKNTTNLDIKKEPFTLNLNAKLESNMKKLKSFSGLEYNLSFGLDYSKEKGNLGLGIKDGNDSIINVLASVVNDTAYVKCDELLNRVINVGEFKFADNFDFSQVNTTNINYDNIEYILKSFKNILIDSLDVNKFTITNETIKIGNKEYDAKKVLYKLDKENLERTAKFIVDKMSNDEKLLQNIADLTNSEVKEE